MNMPGLTQRIFGNGVAGLYGLGVTVVSQILTVPVFISFWGKARYGEWLVLVSIPAYLIFSDFGFGQVAGNKMAMLHAEKKTHEMIAVLHTMWSFQSVLGLVLFGAGAATFLHLPWGHWLGMATLGDHRVGWLLLGLLTYVLLNMQALSYTAIYRSCGEMARFLVISSTSRLMEMLVMLAIVFLRLAEERVVLGMIGVRLATLAYYNFDARRRFPNLQVGFRYFSRLHFFGLFKPGMGHFGIGIGQSLQLQGMTLVLNRFLGPEAVATYSVARTLTRIPYQCVVLLNGAIYPEFSALVVNQELRKARDIHRIMLQFSLWTSVMLAGLALTAGPAVISMWTLGKIHVGRTLLAALNLSIIMNLGWFSSSVVLSSINRHAKLGVLYFAATLGALGSACLLARPLGLIGPALASAIAEAAVAAFVLPRACAIVGDNLPAALRDAVRLGAAREHFTQLYRNLTKQRKLALARNQANGGSGMER